jgi:hypothetical protein
VDKASDLSWKDGTGQYRVDGGKATRNRLPGDSRGSARPGWGDLASCRLAPDHTGRDGHRTVMTTESSSACHEWSMPGPQTA